ncbi:MAG TPA: PAS domain-containing protein, partial [Anaerolineales bacterium]|nr:PAS domain-containing protein [Anaerolineales bacterium]
GQPLQQLLWGDQPVDLPPTPNEPVDTEFPLLTGWFRHSVFDLPSDLDGVRRVHVLRDITQQKQAEEGLRTSQVRYRRLFEEAPVMYLQLRDEFEDPIVEQVNQAFLTTLGYRKEEVLG